MSAQGLQRGWALLVVVVVLAGCAGGGETGTGVGGQGTIPTPIPTPMPTPLPSGKDLSIRRCLKPSFKRALG